MKLENLTPAKGSVKNAKKRLIKLKKFLNVCKKKEKITLNKNTEYYPSTPYGVDG